MAAITQYEFYTKGVHNCPVLKKTLLTTQPDISKGRRLPAYRFRTKINELQGYTLIICLGCNQTVAAVR